MVEKLNQVNGISKKIGSNEQNINLQDITGAKNKSKVIEFALEHIYNAQSPTEAAVKNT